MSRFLGFTIFFVIAGGLAIHTGLELPWFFDWFGRLPGDMVIRKESVTFYVPLTSSALISIVLTCFFSLFSGKGK